MKTAVNRKVRHQESQRPGVRQTTSVASFRVRDDNSGGFKEDRLHRRSDSLPVAVSSGSDKLTAERRLNDRPACQGFHINPDTRETSLDTQANMHPRCIETQSGITVSTGTGYLSARSRAQRRLSAASATAYCVHRN